MLTDSYDRTAEPRTRSPASPSGRPCRHENEGWFVAFSPDGRSVLTGGQQKAHLWRVPQITNLPIEELEPSVEAATGMRLLEDGTLQVLDASEWDARRESRSDGTADRTSLR